MKTILITGASGFIAPHVIKASLDKNLMVMGIDILDQNPGEKVVHKNYTFKKMDVRDLNLEIMKNVDYVLHLAFVTNIPNSIQNPVDTTKDNIDMTVFLLNLCVEAKVKKFLFPSTGSLYGNNPIPWNEDMMADPIEPYSFQKLSCEIACKTWTACYGLPTTVFRFFQVYGGETLRSAPGLTPAFLQVTIPHLYLYQCDVQYQVYYFELNLNYCLYDVAKH